MRPEVAKDLSDSAYDFLRVVWPAVRGWCRSGELKPVESVAPREFEHQLDTLAGIDAWQVVHGKGIRGISSRVQWLNGDNYWTTFTIRKARFNGAKTELENRIAAMKDASGFIRPALLVHAYVQKPRRAGKLNYACMCRADDLFKLATNEKRGTKLEMLALPYDSYQHKGYAWYEETNPQDGNTFAVFPVDALIGHGVRVREFPARPSQTRMALDRSAPERAEKKDVDWGACPF